MPKYLASAGNLGAVRYCYAKDRSCKKCRFKLESKPELGESSVDRKVIAALNDPRIYWPNPYHTKLPVSHHFTVQLFRPVQEYN